MACRVHVLFPHSNSEDTGAHCCMQRLRSMWTDSQNLHRPLADLYVGPCEQNFKPSDAEKQLQQTNATCPARHDWISCKGTACEIAAGRLKQGAGELPVEGPGHAIGGTGAASTAAAKHPSRLPPWESPASGRWCTAAQSAQQPNSRLRNSRHH